MISIDLCGPSISWPPSHSNNCWKLTGGKKREIDVLPNFIMKMFDPSGFTEGKDGTSSYKCTEVNVGELLLFS